MHIKIGSRGSKLAIAQTQSVIDILKNKYPNDSFEIVVIATTGDKEQVKALDKIGSKGVFTDEIENALINGEIQLAVHSMKDMPSEIREGLTFTKTLKREDSRDVLILREAKSLKELKQGAIIATGSKRRAFQIKALRPDIEIVGIRGNIDTRIRKLNEVMPDGRYIDGIVLAAAGIKRLNREAEITEYLSVEDMIPAPAQGALAIEVKKDNTELLEKINCLCDDYSEISVKAERNFLAAIGGDCHLPIGACLENKADGNYRLLALFGNEDGSVLNRVSVDGNDIDELVKKAVDKLNG